MQRNRSVVEPGKESDSFSNIVLSVFKWGLLLTVTGLVLLFKHGALPSPSTPVSLVLQQLQQQHTVGSPSAAGVWGAAAARAAAGKNSSVPLLLAGFPAAVAEAFPQVEHCGLGPGVPRRWVQSYAQLHAAVRSATLANSSSSSSRTYDKGGTSSGASSNDGSSINASGESWQQQRYLVSIPHLSGTADHIIGLVTQFYLALLGQRAFTVFTPPAHPPGLAAACDFPFFNWTHPEQLPHTVLASLPQQATSRTDMAPNAAAIYPEPYQHYALHNMVNPLDRDLELLETADMADFPAGNSSVPVVLSTTNRGASYTLSRNPHHKEQFWEYGMRPETAFMCGFWSLCSPNAAVQGQYMEKFWQPLQRPEAFKIGIQVRFGDQLAFLHKADMSPAALMAMATPYFECATALEQAFAAQSQPVIWYIISDSSTFRRAAKEKYGDKVLTDDQLQLMHVACHLNDDPSLCKETNLQSAVQHSVGEMLTFSLTDYHIITQSSGFGRVGAWLSGRWGNIFELAPGSWDAARVCPHRPTSPKKSANHWSRI